MNKTFGLREQIKHAQSEKEITDLLIKSKTYEWASEFTKRAWKSTAKFRIAQLTSNDPAQTAKMSVDSNKVVKKYKKNK